MASKTEYVGEWAAGLCCISVLPECFCCRITKCIYFNCTGNGTHQCLDTAPVAFSGYRVPDNNVLIFLWDSTM